MMFFVVEDLFIYICMKVIFEILWIDFIGFIGFYFDVFKWVLLVF